MKRLTLLALLLTSCAYNPPVDMSNIDPAKYHEDAEECAGKHMRASLRETSPFGLIGIVANRAFDDPAKLAESDAANAPGGKKAFIDKCMKAKGYALKVPG